MAYSVFDCMTDEARRRDYDAIADYVRRCAEAAALRCAGSKTETVRRCFEAAAARCVGHEAAVVEEAAETEESVRQRFREINERDGFEAAVKDRHGDHVEVRDARGDVEEWRRQKAARPLFAFDADEPARLRRAFASWDFSNGT